MFFFSRYYGMQIRHQEFHCPEFNFTPSVLEVSDVLLKGPRELFSNGDIAAVLFAFPTSDGRPRDVRRRRWQRDASPPGDAPAWHASGQPLAGVTRSSASPVPLRSGLWSRAPPMLFDEPINTAESELLAPAGVGLTTTHGCQE